VSSSLYHFCEAQREVILLSSASCLRLAVAAAKSIDPVDLSLSQALLLLSRRPCNRIVPSVSCSFGWATVLVGSYQTNHRCIPLRKLFVASYMSLLTHATAFPRLRVTFARWSPSRPCHYDVESTETTKRLFQIVGVCLAGHQGSALIVFIPPYG